MLLHHMHSELLLVHSLHVERMAHGVRHCLALWLAEEHVPNVRMCKTYRRSLKSIYKLLWKPLPSSSVVLQVGSPCGVSRGPRA